jgi:hypothetical protein
MLWASSFGCTRASARDTHPDGGPPRHLVDDAGQLADGGMDGGSMRCRSGVLPKCNPVLGCDWSAKRALYRGCDPGPVSLQPRLVRCGPYDAVFKQSTVDGFGKDFYDPDTGQLVGSFDQGNGGSECTAYDPSFVPPDAGCVAPDGVCACTPVDPDSRWPATWSAAVTSAPCSARTCGTYDAVTVLRDGERWSLFYDRSSGELAGGTHPSGFPQCSSYTPATAPLFVAPLETSCTPFAAKAQCSDAGIDDGGSP